MDRGTERNEVREEVGSSLRGVLFIYNTFSDPLSASYVIIVEAYKVLGLGHFPLTPFNIVTYLA